MAESGRTHQRMGRRRIVDESILQFFNSLEHRIGGNGL